MVTRLIALIGLVAVLVVACGGARVDSSETALDGTWALESGTLDGAPIPLVDGYPITFNASGSAFNGTAACNQYGGLFAVEAWEMTIHEFNITEMACEPAVMESEGAYVLAIRRINLASHEGDRLVLTGPGTELRFVATPEVPDDALVGTTWILDGLASGNSVSTVRGDPLDLVFHADGTFRAGTGCRTLSGSYLVSGNHVEMPELTTEGECPAELQAQDDHVVAVFEGFTVAIDGDRLTMTAAGNEGLVYRAG
jgi:heat shock protein HslJ